jgi:hypothetical protein
MLLITFSGTLLMVPFDEGSDDPEFIIAQVGSIQSAQSKTSARKKCLEDELAIGRQHALRETIIAFHVNITAKANIMILRSPLCFY